MAGRVVLREDRLELPGRILALDVVLFFGDVGVGDVDLEQVAAVCDLSLSHFARAFRQTYGKPPYRWLIERRIDKAKDLLMNTRLPLSDIAVRCGFTDQSGFNRSFKRMYGITPGIWRRNHG